MRCYTRREFLKISCCNAAGALVSFHGGFSKIVLTQSIFENFPLGRVLSDRASSHKYPDINSDVVTTFLRNDIISISCPITIQSNFIHREVWHQLEDNSFIQARDIQPVNQQLNIPLSEVSTYGQLAEVTVPFTSAYYRKRTAWKPNQIFYFGSLHWIYELVTSSYDRLYYRIKEDRWGDSYYVDARHIHVLEPDELSPISPEVDPGDKKIQVSIQDQLVIAYERDQAVFTSSMASGLLTAGRDYSTPLGSYQINYKRPSRHMLHSDRVGINGSELYGVPWVTYFTHNGIAFHGTYWHNDFSQPRSHGCINLPIPAARWIYRWSLPTVPPREKAYVSRYGTSVEIF